MGAADKQTPVADYIVVGAGSAGCVIANRLTERPDRSVLLLEAGHDDRLLSDIRRLPTNLLIRIPVGYARLLTDPRAAWLYESEPDPVTGRRYRFPRGKVLGGSSAINGLMYVRGLASDYDGWRQLGCDGWSWADVLPFMVRSQDGPGPADEQNGVGGPQTVSESEHYGATDAFLAACAEDGITAGNVDADGEGVSYVRMTARRGLRASTAPAFLEPARSRSNLTVETGCLAARILFDGRRAVGVEFNRNGETRRVHARREVVLSAGPINSPKLLQLSGIGPAAELAALGIEPLVDSPRVGRNLQDHFAVAVALSITRRGDSYNHRTRGLGLAIEALSLGLRRRGVLTNPSANLTGFVRSRPELDIPDLQLFALAGNVDPERTMASNRIVMRQEPGMTVVSYPARPRSRGVVALRSADPTEAPTIQPNFLSDPYDQALTVAGLRRIDEIVGRPSMAAIIRKRFPPADRIDQMSDDQLLDFARASGVSAYHACGTCEMGADPLSVVDPQLRVRGTHALRVADGSIMPKIVSGNLNATCIMIGEKCADLIASDT